MEYRWNTVGTGMEYGYDFIQEGILMNETLSASSPDILETGLNRKAILKVPYGESL